MGSSDGGARFYLLIVEDGAPRLPVIVQLSPDRKLENIGGGLLGLDCDELAGCLEYIASITPKRYEYGRWEVVE